MNRPIDVDAVRFPPFGETDESSFISRSPEETRAFACALGQTAPDGTVFALCGDLGSGKTCFAQGLALALGIEQPVTSPTFGLIREYRGKIRMLYHVDLYRLDAASDLNALGIDDCLDPDGLAAFEWADRMPGLFPPNTVWVRLETLAHPEERRIALKKGSSAESAGDGQRHMGESELVLGEKSPKECETRETVFSYRDNLAADNRVSRSVNRSGASYANQGSTACECHCEIRI